MFTLGRNRSSREQFKSYCSIIYFAVAGIIYISPHAPDLDTTFGSKSLSAFITANIKFGSKFNFVAQLLISFLYLIGKKKMQKMVIRI